QLEQHCVGGGLVDLLLPAQVGGQVLAQLGLGQLGVGQRLLQAQVALLQVGPDLLQAGVDCLGVHGDAGLGQVLIDEHDLDEVVDDLGAGGGLLVGRHAFQAAADVGLEQRLAVDRGGDAGGGRGRRDRGSLGEGGQAGQRE